MTPRRRPSEKERLYLFVFLFPPLWPIGIAMLIGDMAVGIGNGVRNLWRRIMRKDQS